MPFEISTEVPSPEILHRLRWNARMMFGWFADYIQSRAPITEAREYRRILAHYEKFREHSRTDRLSDEEIEYWSTRIDMQDHIKDRRELFKTTPLNQTPHGIAVDLIDALTRQASTSKAESNALQMRVELQADCLAGIWANRSQQKNNFLDPGDPLKAKGIWHRRAADREVLAQCGA